jgi:hypothetical protein
MIEKTKDCLRYFGKGWENISEKDGMKVIPKEKRNDG